MDLGLGGHTALVTGSSGGVGAAIAATLAREGCRVLVHGRHRATADEVAGQIGATDVVLGDLTDDDERAQVADTAVAAGVDVLVANAGPFAEHTWDDVDPASWQQVFAANVTATAALIARLLPSLRERGWGRIVTVASRAVVTPLPNMVEYSAAKAAVANLTVGLAAHLAGTGVTANCVSPGVILTPSLERMFLDRYDDASVTWDDVEAEVTADYAPNPCGRLGRPDDVADLVAFLAGPRADYVNAAVLRVDGGITGAV